jgi:rhodanese-related sulfurtransferase
MKRLIKMEGGTMKRIPILFVTIMMLASTGLARSSDDFPLRKKYPHLEPITSLQLAKARASDEAIIIDVRTKAEFDIMHIKGAIHVPHILSEEQQTAWKTAAEKPHQYAVFYCNGVLCAKSYKAADLALSQGNFRGVRNFDAGILEWAETYPEETLFFGQPLTRGNVKEHLISDSDFKQALVDTSTFIDMARSGSYAVYDIRDSREKAEYPVNIPNKKEATLDELQQLLKEDLFPKSRVLLLDNVGRQVVWAQYYLNRFGVKEYSFLAGGIAQWRADGRDSKGDKLGKVFGRPSSRN